MLMTAGLMLMVLPAAVLSSPTADAPALAVSIAVASQGQDQYIEYRRPADHFHVIVANRSATAQKVWQEWNSWGHGALSFELKNEAGKTWIARKKPGAWTRNFPSSWSIAPGDELVFDVYWGDETLWEGFPPFETAREKLRIRAIYEIPSDADAKEHGVWTGRVVSEVREILFSKWRLDGK